MHGAERNANAGIERGIVLTGRGGARMMRHRAHIQKLNHNEESMRTFKGFPGGFVAICVVMLSAHVSLFAQPPAGSGNQRMVLIETVIHPSAVAEYEAAMKLRCAAIVK